MLVHVFFEEVFSELNWDKNEKIRSLLSHELIKVPVKVNQLYLILNLDV